MALKAITCERCLFKWAPYKGGICQPPGFEMVDMSLVFKLNKAINGPSRQPKLG